MERGFEVAIWKKKAHDIIRSVSERNAAEFARKVGEAERFESMAEYIAYTKKVYDSEYYSHILTYTMKEAPARAHRRSPDRKGLPRAVKSSPQ